MREGEGGGREGGGGGREGWREKEREGRKEGEGWGMITVKGEIGPGSPYVM